MENQIWSAFKNSDLNIEDGFEFGDWRDQCITDKSYDECFSPRKSFYEDQDKIGKLLQTLLHRLPLLSTVIKYSSNLTSNFGLYNF